MSVNGKMIELASGDGTPISSYHVAPKGERKGGLVLIQEIFGVTDHIKSCCDVFAAEGYEVLAPSVYDRVEKGFQAAYSEFERAVKIASQTRPHMAIDDVQMCIDFLKARGPVFLTGYCYGGSVAWVGACRCHDLAAASGYYGRLVVNYAKETPKCPVILHFGEHDESIPLSDVEIIKEAHPDIPVYVYDAGHGFNSDRVDHYDETSAKLAFKRTLDLFAEHL